MFWSRKEKIITGTLGPIKTCPVPAKPAFVTMLEILKDAEKYDNENNNDVRDVLLTILCEKIEIFKSKNNTN